MLTLEILIDDKKLKDTKNECYELLSKKHYQDALDHFLKHHNARVNFFQKFRFFKWIALLVSILTALFSIYFLIIWITEERQVLVFFLFSLALSVTYGFVFINYDKMNKTKDKTHQLNKFLTTLYKFGTNIHLKIYFEDISNQFSPFLVVYDCSDDDIVCYKKMDDDKIKIEQVSIQQFKTSHYLMGDNCCLIFEKPTSQDFQIFLWIDNNNKETLETYLNNQGLTPLVLSA